MKGSAELLCVHRRDGEGRSWDLPPKKSGFPAMSVWRKAGIAERLAQPSSSLLWLGVNDDPSSNWEHLSAHNVSLSSISFFSPALSLLKGMSPTGWVLEYHGFLQTGAWEHQLSELV